MTTDAVPPAIVPVPAPADYLALAQSALDAGAAGDVPADEAINAAEVYARMTGADSPEALRFLGEVYLRHRDLASSAGDAGKEQLFGALAMLRLDQAADAGDEMAANVVAHAQVSAAAITAAQAWAGSGFCHTVATEDRVCAAAGRGDELALNIMLDEVFAALNEGSREKRDAFLLALAIARVGENFAIAGIKRRLAGILIGLGELDREGGNATNALSCEVAALLRLAEAGEAGDAQAVQWLPSAVGALLPAALFASKLNPVILAHIPHMGDCQ